MIGKIIEFSLKNRLIVLLFTVVLVGCSVWSIYNIRLDAIPDLSDVQVIITAEYPGQNPQVVEDQVTYPLTSAMLSVPGSTVVRGFSMFEQSFVYVLFEEGTDIYWARSRVLEYLNFARDRLPQGVEPKLGPDATGVGWVYQYVIYPGYYSPDHPKGFWYDEKSKSWYEDRENVSQEIKQGLVRVRAFEKPGKDPITGNELVKVQLDLSELRSIQDWYLRYPLTAVEDVSEVAAIGGFVKQYQVVLDPVKIQAYQLSLREIIAAIQRSNNDVGGSVIELSETEYMVRSRGYLKGLEDLKKVPVGLGENGVPILLDQIATLQIGGEMRRGVGEYNGEGEAVGGVIIARYGSNAYKVIEDVKSKLADLAEGLPNGVFIKTTYDRSELIKRAVTTLRNTLVEEIIVVGLVCILFLLHMRSELVAVFVVPSSIMIALLIMHILGINANIMSLGGLAISIGVVVDSAIIMVENAHKHLDREEEKVNQGFSPKLRSELILEAAKEVGPQLFFSLLIITVSFLPVFVLGGEAGRLFKPMVFTKTFAMASAAILSITVIPVLMYYFITARVLPITWGKRRNFYLTISVMFVPAALILVLGYSLWISITWAVFSLMLLLPQKIIHEDHSPVSKFLQIIYNPVFRIVMANPWKVICIAIVALCSTLYPISRLGTEFMPPLDEGDLLYMPTTDPSISVTKSKQLLQQTDKLIKTFPEVISVHGKIGRVESATDPAPLSMVETIVRLNPNRDQWRKRKVNGWFYNERPINMDELKFGWVDLDGQQHPGLNSAVNFPGIANAWPYPIENRLNMLSTGIKTPVGIKIIGPDLKILGKLAQQTATLIKTVPGTVSSYADRTVGGYYLDFDINRESAARYGLTVGDVQDVIQSAIGGMNVTTTVEGQERYPLNIRYFRDFKDTPQTLEQVIITSPMLDKMGGKLQIPLSQVATLKINPGPPMIRSENAQRTAWIYVDISGRDLGGYIQDARKKIFNEIKLPPGYNLVFSGQFESWEKTQARLVVATSLTVIVIILLLYLSSRSWFRVGIVILAVPFSLIGAFWLLFALGYNLSLAVVIGIIALAGLDAETGMVMLLYLDNSYDRFKAQGKMNNIGDLWNAIHDGAVKRIRPKAMTVAATFIGLVPLLWAQGTGADTMRRIAAPMIGGLIISFIMELIVYPVLFFMVYQRKIDPNTVL